MSGLRAATAARKPDTSKLAFYFHRLWKCLPACGFMSEQSAVHVQRLRVIYLLRKRDSYRVNPITTKNNLITLQGSIHIAQ